MSPPHRIIAWLCVIMLACTVTCRRARADAPATQPDWVGPMKQVHAKFTGQEGAFAQFGDSITASMAFWTIMKHQRKLVPGELATALAFIDRHMRKDDWVGKGPKLGNQGQMTVRWAAANVDAWLKDLNPEVAVYLFGTNDLNAVKSNEEYETKTREVVTKCLANGTIAILTTIPPRHRREKRSAEFADIVRKIARELHTPLIDFYAEILKRRPDDWSGALDKFKAYRGYDVPTLLSRDGVHPSAPQKYRGDYSPEALNNSGYNLRNYLTALAYAEVIRRVLKPNLPAPTTQPEQGPTTRPAERLIFMHDFEREGDFDGTRNSTNVPKTNRRCLAGVQEAGKAGLGLLVPGPLKVGPGKLFIAFDYLARNTAFISILAPDRARGKTWAHVPDLPVQGKWTRAAIEMTAGPNLLTAVFFADAKPLATGDAIDGIGIVALPAADKQASLLVDNVRLYANMGKAAQHGPAKPTGPAEYVVFSEDFEGKGEWRGKVIEKDLPPLNRYSLEAVTVTNYFAKKIRVGVRTPPLPVANTTFLSFDYYLEGSDFLSYFLFDLDIRDNEKFRIGRPVVGKWTSVKVEVTGGRLRAGHKVDDIFFFAGRPGDKGVKLLVDNVRLTGVDE